MENKKVLVGVSGGVDSSVCVDILRNSGYEVYGAVINFNIHSKTAIEDAKKACEHLNIPICVVDARDSFEKNVVLPFCQSYINGETPNPCVICNPLVKFKVLSQKADEMGIRYISTGHYAQTEERDGFFYIKKAISLSKDQSYMLYRLPQDILKRLILPLGQYEKSSIREQAENIGLFNAQKPDSQEICFIPSGDHASFIEAKGFMAKKGFFISPDGENLGAHKGVHHYTIGQRKGLNLSLGKPAFIKEISENGNILLGFAGEEFFNKIVLSGVVYTDKKPIDAKKEYSVKIRSASNGEAVIVEKSDNHSIVLSFLSPTRAAAKGQSAVIYDKDLVIGGGFITDAVAKI